ncbi:MAG: tRNA 2-thiouridine(34) synthase MnmA [Candidatus Parcubacteria bacterium]|nr:tRNA 2-thiouridine(34) synthase MnmA [Candidatus Parcubacteria bacterium]
MKKRLKVFCALSGGVDSATSAALLKRAGYDVTGIFMKNWAPDETNDSGCPWAQDQEDAQSVARALGIPFYTFDFQKEYKNKVVDYLFNGYAKGETPNPDTLCNREIKFGLFLTKALALGADMIATGHYARVRHPNWLHPKEELLKGVDKNKDQSYFLWQLNQNQLAHTLFPIGHLTKPEVRKLAIRFKIPVATKPDSQGICFVGKVKLADFLEQRIPSKTGPVVLLPENKIVANHEGAAFYTLGQRHGFGGGGGEAYFIVKKDIENNIIYVARKDYPDLWSHEIRIHQLSWIDGQGPQKWPLKTAAKIRYRQADQQVTWRTKSKQELIGYFENPQWTPTTGQSVVIYSGNKLLGGGIIE